jgi:hypothetical protein
MTKPRAEIQFLELTLTASNGTVTRMSGDVTVTTDAGGGEPLPEPPDGGGVDHAYFNALRVRSDCVAAVSFRDQAEIDALYSKAEPRRLSYCYPDDPDPRRQDLGKLVLPDGCGNFGNGIVVPIPPANGKVVFVTWDQWLGAEFHYAHTAINNQKGFPYIGDDRSGGGFFEWQINYSTARHATHNQPPGGDPALSEYDGKPKGYVTMFQPQSLSGATPHYPPCFRGAHSVDDAGNTLRVVMPHGAPPKEQRDYGECPGPLAAEFGLVAEKLFRTFWVFAPIGGRDWCAWIWAADVDRDPVLVLDAWTFTADTDQPFSTWHLHVGIGNADANDAARPGRGPLTAYLGNLIVLHAATVEDVFALLQRPAVSSAADPTT